jgi:cephalosporin-C deacetylase-like acetyl esterase
MKNELVEINKKALNTVLGMLVGKSFPLKKKGKRKSVINFHGYEISVKNEILNFDCCPTTVRT